MKVFNMWRTLMTASLCAAMACTFTACDDDDDDPEGGQENLNEEKWDISNMKVEGTKDGKIVFSGSVKSTKKLTKFTAKDASGAETPLFNKDDKNISIKDLAESIEVDGKTITWKYETLISGELDMTKGPFTLTCDLRFTKSVDITLGTKYEWKLGTKSADDPSYGSFKDGKAYTMNEAKADPKKIEVILKTPDGGTEDKATLSSAENADNADIKAGCAKAILTGDGTTGTIVTSDGCCATYTIGAAEASGTGFTKMISGLRYGTETGISIDTSAAFKE